MCMELVMKCSQFRAEAALENIKLDKKQMKEV